MCGSTFLLRNFRPAILLRYSDLLIIPSFGEQKCTGARARRERERREGIREERTKKEEVAFVSVKLLSASGISPRTFLLSTSSRLGLNSQFLDHTFALLLTYIGRYRMYIYATAPKFARQCCLEKCRSPAVITVASISPFPASWLSL